MSITALENIILKLYAQIADARKCQSDARKLRQQAYRISADGRRLNAEARRDLAHAETMLALKRGQQVNVVPFPTKKPIAGSSTVRRKQKA